MQDTRWDHGLKVAADGTGLVGTTSSAPVAAELPLGGDESPSAPRGWRGPEAWARSPPGPRRVRRPPGGVVVYARVSSHDQRAGLDRQVARLAEWAAGQGLTVGEVVREVGSGLGGSRPKLRRVLSDPSATVIVVEHRDRLARFGVGHLEAALAADGRRLVVADPGERTDDLVGDMVEVLTSVCARLYGRRGAGNRAMRAMTAAKNTDAGAAA
jgi:putative resolvase